MSLEAETATGHEIAPKLIRLLHRGGSAEDFAACLAQAQALPDDPHEKPRAVELVRMAMALHNRLDLWQQRESGMLAVIESARDLSSRLDLDDVLHAIVSRARNLLGSHVAWLSTYDPALHAFHVLATDGALAHSTGDMVAASDMGIVGVVLRTRLPFTTSDYLSDKRFTHDEALDATFRDEGVAAVVGVPLLWDDEVIGLLFVADRYHRTHTAHNISILSTLATHGAVAIKNARAFEQASAAAAAAEAARAALESHSRKVQAAAEAHEQLTSLLARGASLATLCESVAGLAGGDVLVLDEASQVIARGSGPAAGRAASLFDPNGGHSRALAAALRESRQVGRSVVAYEHGGETCRVCAVIAGDEVLGAVLLFRREALDETVVRTFERSTSIVGIVLLARERLDATRSRDQSALLRALLSPRQDELPALCERAAGLGVALHAQPCSLLLLELGHAQAAHAERRLRAGNLLPHALFDEVEGVLTVLCPTPQAEDVRRAVTQLAQAEFGGDYRGVLSRPLADATRLPAAYSALRRALPVLRRLGVAGRVVAQNEMALYSTLFETHDAASLAAFLETTIGAITAYDQRRGTELTETLLSYFDSNQNAKLAAQRLEIHVNTVRQRLATIEELIGHWGQATRALEIHMALRLWSLSRRA